MADSTLKKPQKPNLGVIAPAENGFNPLKLSSLAAADYTKLLSTNDSILEVKGGIENLKIYAELLRDDQVCAAWEQRRLALTSCDTVIDPGADDELSKAAALSLDAELKALDWDDITDKMLSGRFYGWSVAEIIWGINGDKVTFADIKVRDRARFRFDIDNNLYLWSLGNGFRLMPERKFWTYSAGADNHDEPYGLGLAHSLYWPVFFKRNDIKFWLIFLEKFGMPTAMAKIDQGKIQDEEEVAKAKLMLQQIATDAGVVVPDTISVEFLEAVRTGSVDYGAMHEAMNKAISKIIVGQTATTEGTPGKLGAETLHQDTIRAIVKADADLLCSSFNNGPVRWWTEWNYPGAVPPRVYRVTDTPEDMNQRAERDVKIYGMGYAPTEEYIQTTYGDGWEKSNHDTTTPTNFTAQNKSIELAEGDSLNSLMAEKLNDQDKIADAAKAFAEQDLLKDRVKQVLRAAEFADDPDMLRRNLNEMLKDKPKASFVDKLMRANLVSKLLGRLGSDHEHA